MNDCNPAALSNNSLAAARLPERVQPLTAEVCPHTSRLRFSSNYYFIMMTAIIDRIILVVLILLVAGTALAHGAVEPWSVALFELLVVALILLAGAKYFLAKKIELALPAAALPLLSLIAFGLIQGVSFASAEGQSRSLSFDVESTRQTVALLFFITVAFVIAANTFSSRERLFRLANFLVIYGLALSVFALIQHFTWNGSFYWIRPNTQSTSPFGPFVNHNHFAGYMEMIMPLALALALVHSARLEARMFYLFAASVMCVAVLASLSRGGMISLAVSAIAVTLWGWNRRSAERSLRRSSRFAALARRAALVVTVLVGAGLGLIWVGPDRLADRLSNEESQAETFHESRSWIWEDTLQMIRANPLFGVGLGAYGTAHSVYRKEDRELQVAQAHNDYLQIVADCGAVGGLITVWFVVLVFRAIRQGLAASDPLTSALALGSGGGILAMMIHSLVDFNLQLPSNALMFLLLVATSSNAAVIARRQSSLGEHRRERAGSRQMRREPAISGATVH